MLLRLLSKYPFHHKIDKFFVNFNDKTISVLVNEKLEAVKLWHLDLENYFFTTKLHIQEESLEKIKDIIRKQNNSILDRKQEI